jgi:hypothetical protein
VNCKNDLNIILSKDNREILHLGFGLFATKQKFNLHFQLLTVQRLGQAFLLPLILYVERPAFLLVSFILVFLKKLSKQNLQAHTCQKISSCYSILLGYCRPRTFSYDLLYPLIYGTVSSLFVLIFRFKEGGK